ncbi:MAG: TatA/E family protein of Tat protein translocase [Candidatus Deianiraeaceae bacterium]|jgi:TatA/E family protein of Tat protein translocase
MLGFKELILVLLIILLIFGAGKLPYAIKSIIKSLRDIKNKEDE